VVLSPLTSLLLLEVVEVRRQILLMELALAAAALVDTVRLLVSR
jgi:hypothetical protein